jgi:hypothetical protein
LSVRRHSGAAPLHKRHPRRRGTSAFAAALTVLLGVAAAAAQGRPPTKLWDIPFGTPVAALPLDDFVDPACGTNGGPPARVLKGFDEFALCSVDRVTGLREVWFRYDDEREYIARARRSELLIRQYSANALAGQPIITSLLISDAGLVEGYRVVTDQRAEGSTRLAAYGLADIFKGMVHGSDIICTDLPPSEGERPVEDLFVKQVCERRYDGKLARVEARLYYKPGQYAVDPNDNRVTENLFESSARLEVYRPPTEAR